MNTEDNRLKSNCIQEGGRSFHESKGRYINLYKQGSTQFNDFERGWSQALKRSSEQLLRDYRAAKKAPRRQSTALPKLTPSRKKKEMSEDTYNILASRAREKLLNNPSYQPSKYAWRTNVYYVRIEANEMPLWPFFVEARLLPSGAFTSSLDRAQQMRRLSPKGRNFPFDGEFRERLNGTESFFISFQYDDTSQYNNHEFTPDKA